jgi:hypothetical protein
VKNSIATPTGYSSSAYYGAASIDAPKDCNGQSTFITSKVFTGSPFDARLCAAACDAQNIDHAKTGAQQCRYFNTYILSRNNVALGQYCNLFTQAWTASQATYKGITSGANKYTISYSFGVSASSDAGNCNKESSPPTSDTGKPPVTGPSTGADGFINWKTFKANGVNLGSWLEKEKNHGEFMLFTFDYSRHVLMTTLRHILVEQYQRRPFDHGRMELVCLTWCSVRTCFRGSLRIVRYQS